MTFGQYLTHIRGDMAQRRLAQKCQCSGQYIADLEKDRRNAPPDAMLARIADATESPLDVLHYYAGSIPPDCRGHEDRDRIMKAWHAFREVLTQ